MNQIGSAQFAAPLHSANTKNMAKHASGHFMAWHSHRSSWCRWSCTAMAPRSAPSAGTGWTLRRRLNSNRSNSDMIHFSLGYCCHFWALYIVCIFSGMDTWYPTTELCSRGRLQHLWPQHQWKILLLMSGGSHAPSRCTMRPSLVGTSCDVSISCVLVVKVCSHAGAASSAWMRRCTNDMEQSHCLKTSWTGQASSCVAQRAQDSLAVCECLMRANVHQSARGGLSRHGDHLHSCPGRFAAEARQRHIVLHDTC